MKTNRRQRALTSWVLYFSILFGALACAVGHGQVTGLQLSGVGQFCSLDGSPDGAPHPGEALPPGVFGTGGCVLVSSFAAIILAAFFGLLGLLALGQRQSLPAIARLPVRHDRWPSANPRASPSFLPVA